MRSLTVTLLDDIVQAIEAKVAAGDYASESDLVRDSIAFYIGSDTEFDEHEMARIRASCDEMKADPSSAIPIGEVMERIQRRFADER